jgi:predicted nucleotidyltransferase
MNTTWKSQKEDRRPATHRIDITKSTITLCPRREAETDGVQVVSKPKMRVLNIQQQTTAWEGKARTQHCLVRPQTVTARAV